LRRMKEKEDMEKEKQRDFKNKIMQ